MKVTLESNKPTQNQAIYDVIISGAGPVGLFLACELALAKCSVLILEKEEQLQSPLKRLPFGMRGLSTPSIESLDRRGLLGELELHKRVKNPHANSNPSQAAPARRQAGHFAGIPFYADNMDTSQWKYRLPNAKEPVLLSEMEELETILTRRAMALGVTIKRGIALRNFHQIGEELTVDSVDQSFKGKWLVGCDGARSIVRKLAGFEFAGTEPEFTGYSVQVELADPEKLQPGRNVTARGMYLQSQPGYLILQDFDAGAFHNSGKEITLGHLQEVLRRISNTDVTIDALHMATTWTDRSRQVTAYRNGKVFLAGDAAHIHSPLGGQGLNLGLGDAMNLGWKLAAVIQGKATEGLLDSYHTERYPVGEQVLDWSRAQVAIMKPGPDARALKAIVSDLMETRDGTTYIAGRVWGIYTRINLAGDHPLTGYSVPDFEFEDGSRIADHLQNGQGILLNFKGNTSVKALATGFGDQMKYVSAQAKVSFGLSAVLIRPDGFVAWASDDELNEHTVRNLLASFGFHRNANYLIFDDQTENDGRENSISKLE